MKDGIGRIGETQLVSLISKWLRHEESHPALLRGIGDDCATIRGEGKLLLTIDALVEDVHFRRRWATAQDVGWKSLAVSISDVAAGGGTPQAALVSLELPTSLKVGWVRGFFGGLRACARRYGVAIAGGNVCAGARVAVHVALVGSVTGRAPGRGGARPGDLIAVSGRLGASRAGLLCLRLGIRGAAARAAIRRHLKPRPNVAVGGALARFASAQVDVSDGLLREAGLVAAASKARLALVPGAIPVHRAAASLALRLGTTPARLAIESGEEYEQLATIPRGRMPAAVSAAQRAGTMLTVIGEVRPGRGVCLIGERGRAAGGYEHFV